MSIRYGGKSVSTKQERDRPLDVSFFLKYAPSYDRIERKPTTFTQMYIRSALLPVIVWLYNVHARNELFWMCAWEDTRGIEREARRLSNS